MEIKRSRQYKYDMVENWLRSTNEQSLLELKEKCCCWRKVSGNNTYYPYECVVWVYSKGPDGRRMSYKAIAQELEITPKKAHESKWIGLYLLGYRAADHPPRTKRMAAAIEKAWQ